MIEGEETFWISLPHQDDYWKRHFGENQQK